MASFNTHSPKPPILDGSNYTYWKSMMEIYLLSKHCGDAITTKWENPKMASATNKDEIVEKPKSLWNDNDKADVAANFTALYDILSSVDPTRHKLIVKCRTAKDASDILQRQFEGNDSVRASKLQR